MTETLQQNTYSVIRGTDANQLHAIKLLDGNWLSNNLDQIFSSLPIKSELPMLQCEYPKIDRIEFDALFYGVMDIVSERLADFLCNKISAEFIPIKGYHQGKLYSDKQFYLMHLFDRCDALDLSRSIYHSYPPEAGGGISTVEKIILDEGKINRSPAFILEKPSLTCFRNDICHDIVSNGFKGLKFLPIHEYQNVRFS